MAERRVAITGIGVVTAAGIGLEEHWRTLLSGAGAVSEISVFDAGGFPSRVGGELKDFSARKFVPKTYRKAVKVMARDIEIAVAAADLAVRDSGIATAGTDPENPTVDSKRLGCNIGAGLICSDLDELGSAVTTAVVDGVFDLKSWGAGGINNLTPLWLLKYLPNMLSCHVTIIHKAEGPSNTITCGSASGHLSVGEAMRWIQRGAADVAIAGGAESKLNPMGMLRQELLKRLRADGTADPAGACRPFDAGHCGTVAGEGGALLILEDLDRAVARGAEIYAEVAGFAAACDPLGVDLDRPTAGGVDLAMTNALRGAGIGPDDVDMLMLHGTGVPGEDAAEAVAVGQVLGARAAAVPAAAVTGAVGSLFAGAGGVELATAAMALKTQTVPPTVNFAAPAEGCRLGLSPRPREMELNYLLSGAFSAVGQSGACVLKRYHP